MALYVGWESSTHWAIRVSPDSFKLQAGLNLGRRPGSTGPLQFLYSDSRTNANSCRPILSFSANTSSVLCKMTICAVKNKSYCSLTNTLRFLTGYITFIRLNCHCEGLNGPVLASDVKIKVY